jgi:phosphate transport system substrate-binding protein
MITRNLITTVTVLAAVALAFFAAETLCLADDLDFKEPVTLNGAGATFPFPLYSKWVSEFNKLHPKVRINYQSIGSGGGIKQISENTVDFGGTDAAMKDDALAKLSGTLHHIPTTIGAVVVTYNVKELPGRIVLDGGTLSEVFLGTVRKWNDPKIAALNPGVGLPDTEIRVVHRSDGSGTTAVFTDYLSKVSPEWKSKVGTGTSVAWPAGLGAKGNEGVTGQVKTTPNTLGYVELAYAIQNRLPYATIKNRAGKAVEPSLESISAAAGSAKMPDDFRVSITDAPGDNSYPIAAFTWILVYEKQKDRNKGAALANFLWWAARDGQKFGAVLHYAPLPGAVVEKVQAKLKALTCDGKPLISR